MSRYTEINHYLAIRELLGANISQNSQCVHTRQDGNTTEASITPILQMYIDSYAIERDLIT